MHVQNISIGSSSTAPRQRAATVALVGALHVVAIYALIHALAPSFFMPPPPTTDVDFFKSPPSHPTATPPNPFGGVSLIRPATPIAHEPVIQTFEPATSSTPFVPASGTPATQPMAQSFVPASAIGVTHTTPPYPPLSVRLNQQGDVRLSLMIDAQGAITDAVVISSSGFKSLDAAAVAWVKAHWRYRPAMRNGEPVGATADAIVTFRLLNR